MSFGHSTGIDASRGTFNDVHGTQINNFQTTCITQAGSTVPCGHIHPTAFSTPPTRPAQTATDSNARVAAVLDEAVSAQRQQLDWRHSVVDLLKVLGLDSSYVSRQRLAVYWGYEGDVAPKASYAMNMWLRGRILRGLQGSEGDDFVAGIVEATTL